MANPRNAFYDAYLVHLANPPAYYPPCSDPLQLESDFNPAVSLLQSEMQLSIGRADTATPDDEYSAEFSVTSSHTAFSCEEKAPSLPVGNFAPPIIPQLSFGSAVPPSSPQVSPRLLPTVNTSAGPIQKAAGESILYCVDVV